MEENKYLFWLNNNSKTVWWHDSADSDELDFALFNGAQGATTNPLLVNMALLSKPLFWQEKLKNIPSSIKGDERAEEIIRVISCFLAKKVDSVYFKSNGAQGFVCAQVNPKHPGNEEKMWENAKRINSWAPNISVKLPVTAAGLNVLEECAAHGIPTTMTVSFTVPQVLAVADRYRKGLHRASDKNKAKTHCNAVIMVGRLDDYLRDIALDSKVGVKESDIIQAGTAVMKQAYKIFREEEYEATLMPAGMRGTYHVADFAGAKMILSVGPKIADGLVGEVELSERIDIPVSHDVIDRLKKMPEFIKAYEPNGMKVEEFIGFGTVQRTLSQFCEVGWKPLETYSI
jgi:transaldolase